MPTLCVDTTQVSIIPVPPLVLITLTDSIKAGVQSLVTSSGKLVLLEEDIDAWVKNYESEYITPPFVVPGKVQGKSIELQGLSNKLTVKGKPCVLQSTTGIITLEVVEPAQMPPPVGTPDPLPMYRVQWVVTDAGQTLVTAL